jgi:hypothetical protein
LEISTPVTCNLFFADDPLRFEFVLYSTDGQPVGELKQPIIHYEITDYERFLVASGTVPFEAAKPVTTPVPRYRQNLHLSAVIPDAAAKGVGREFFIHAKLVEGDRVLAEDTVTYAVVNPRKTAPADYTRCRFMTMHEGGGFRNSESKIERQDIMGKMGTSLTHTWDYNGWLAAQPVKGGPITIEPGPDFPKVVYCPNVEQLRSMGSDLTKAVPGWALVDDPLKPGRKTFDIDAYVAYIVAYVRANRHRIVQVVPSGLERVFDARTLELHRKAYAALKKEFPDLPVDLAHGRAAELGLLPRASGSLPRRQGRYLACRLRAERPGYGRRCRDRGAANGQRLDLRMGLPEGRSLSAGTQDRGRIPPCLQLLQPGQDRQEGRE